MALSSIGSRHVEGWDSVQAVINTLNLRNITEVDEEAADLNHASGRILALTDQEYIGIIELEEDENKEDYHSEMTFRYHTQLFIEDDFSNFTFVMRDRDIDNQTGRLRYQQYSINRTKFLGGGDIYTSLDKLNDLEYGEPKTTRHLFDTREVVDDFYNEFEELRSELVSDYAVVPDQDSATKQRYVQVVLNRLIFLYFIQEKGLLKRSDLADENDSGHKRYLAEQPAILVGQEGDLQTDFLEPLFFKLLGEGVDNDEFGQVPYLNGGLFSKITAESQSGNTRIGATAAETQEAYDKIIDFLDSWNWHVDERFDYINKNNISPDILGHIFEKTINQKEKGAYYTPEEITDYMTANSIRPYIIDKINNSVENNEEYRNIDEVFGLGHTTDDDAGLEAQAGAIQVGNPTLIQTEHVEELYFEILPDTHIIDPAVGSGAFLLAAQDVLLDIYSACIEHFHNLRPADRSSRVQSELDEIEDEQFYARREIILENLYGVDIDEDAIEICKLRLWLSMMADIETNPGSADQLPNIDFNIRQGNSLIGFTTLSEQTNSGEERFRNFTEDSIEDRVGDYIEKVRQHKRASDGSQEAADVGRRANEILEEVSEDFDTRIEQEFYECLNKSDFSKFYGDNFDELELDEIVSSERIQNYSAFHWILEFAPVYDISEDGTDDYELDADVGGFDIVIGNPPWVRLKSDQDRYFVRHDAQFRTYSDSKQRRIKKELLEDPEIAADYDEFRMDIKIRSEYFNSPASYEDQRPTVFGSREGTETELAALFTERAMNLISQDGYFSMILPGVIYNGKSTKDIRNELVNNSSIHSMVGFRNGNIFEDVDNRYKFGITVLKNSGESESIPGVFMQDDLSVLLSLNENIVDIPISLLEDYSPEAQIIPYVKSAEEVDALSEMCEYPPTYHDIEGKWKLDPYSELHGTSDNDRFVTNPDDGDYPVLGGRNVYQYNYDSEFVDDLDLYQYWSVDERVSTDDSAHYRIREKMYNSHQPDVGLKKAIWKEFGGEDSSESQIDFVNRIIQRHRSHELSVEDIRLDCNKPRIVIRDVARPTDERTAIAAVIPEDYVCHNTLHTIRAYDLQPTEEALSEFPMHGVYNEIFTTEELFAALGLLNSIPVDFLMRTKVDTHIVQFKFDETHIPRLTAGDDWFEYVSKRAAKLNCYGDGFVDIRSELDIDALTDAEERQECQAEIDAAAFHTYELDEDTTTEILDNFHRVEDPRRMTEDYFSLVSEKYEELAENGPMS
ncbi:type II restriction endonuclease subunit M (plasmid) [Halorubrum sp. BOL3-1]|uniref:Eco57I restriction-modification methylase domain-containing protein n=1 Tax=Halorubrum sp. BOL3-1 TaxID=2497325 RepID=UPI001004E1BB|nr:DNA methyltransferase [Halorubrum sp. BOL3-1]QAU14558.1 type II restriction endonuclease subunit M [Halorubrum sp. BOL3-1]